MIDLHFSQRNKLLNLVATSDFFASSTLKARVKHTFEPHRAEFRDAKIQLVVDMCDEIALALKNLSLHETDATVNLF